MAFRLESAEGSGSGARIGTSLSEINIIPLVDVILVLLLIFMLTAPLMHRGIDVALPKSSAKPTSVEERLVLTLTKEQTIYLNDKPVPVVVEIRQGPMYEYPDLRVGKASARTTRKAGDYAWRITVPAQGEARLSYEVSGRVPDEGD